MKQVGGTGQRTSKLRLLAGSLLVSFLVLAVGQSSAVDVSSEEGALSSFPAFNLPTLADPEVLYDNALFRDRDLTVVNFFASWCAPCLIEHPILMELAGQDVPIIGVNYMDDLAKAKVYLEAEGNPYSIVVTDVDGVLDIPLQIDGIPKTFVVDRDGNTVLRIDGRLREPYLTESLVPLVLTADVSGVTSGVLLVRSDLMDWNAALILVIVSIGGIAMILIRTRKTAINDGSGLAGKMSKLQTGWLLIMVIAGVGGSYSLVYGDKATETASQFDLDEIAAELGTLGEEKAHIGGSAPAGTPDTMSMDAAISRLTQRLEANPKDVEGWVLLARSHSSVGNSDAAIGAFEEAVRKVPDNVELMLYYGEALMAASGDDGLSDKTKDVFSRAIKIAPDHPGARYYHALIPYLDGDVELAHNRWLEMARSAPEGGAPWLSTVQSMLNRSASDLGIEAEQFLSPKPPTDG